VIPLSKGGTGWPANLVPACKSCNLSKAMKNVWEWLALRNSI
jgi:5-methylcytosine-specific restriction endonuclease McrA